MSLTAQQLAGLDPLLQPLAAPQRVRVLSNAALCNKIKATSWPPDAKPVVEALPNVDGWQLLAPAEMLMEMAQASTPPLIPAGLRDLSLRWAWLRYCWAFADPAGRNPKLRLSQASWELAQHHKQVSADQLGVGFALDITRRWLEREYSAWTKVHDADVVIDGGGLSAWGFSHGSALRPDYFIEVFAIPHPQAGMPYSKVYALECKGTHSGIQLSQLRKGLRQVQAVVDHQGNALPSIVSSTSFTRTRTTIRLVDPDEGDGFLRISPDREARAVIEKDEAGRVVVAGPSEFRRELAQLDQAETLAFAGEYANAHEALPSRLREKVARDAGREPSGEAGVSRTVFDRSAAGAQLDLPLVGGRGLRAACVVDDEVLQSARQGDPLDMRRARRRFAEAVQEISDDLVAEGRPAERRAWLESEGPCHLRVVGRDGLALDLTLT